MSEKTNYDFNPLINGISPIDFAIGCNCGIEQVSFNFPRQENYIVCRINLLTARKHKFVRPFISVIKQIKNLYNDLNSEYEKGEPIFGSAVEGYMGTWITIATHSSVMRNTPFPECDEIENQYCITFYKNNKKYEKHKPTWEIVFDEESFTLLLENFKNIIDFLTEEGFSFEEE